MNRCFWNLMICGALVGVGQCSLIDNELRADDVKPLTSQSVAPNSAVIYWQAFSFVPTLKEDDKKKLDAALQSTTTLLSDELKPIVAQYKASLHELHRARAVTVCDWQLENEAGPYLTLTHLQKARDLGRVALLRARLRFAAGETDAAIGDVLATFKLARDCGSSPILISFLVDLAIEKVASDVLAANLPRLKPEQLDQVAAALKQLPRTATLAEAMRWEGVHFGGWLERRVEAEAAKISDAKAGGKLLLALVASASDVGFGDVLSPKPDDADGKRRADMLLSLTVAEVRESVRIMRLDYEEMAKIAELPFDQQSKRWTELQAGLTESRKFTKREDAFRYFSTMLLPTAAALFDRQEQLLVRRDMLEQAIQVQRHGLSVLQPIRGKKVNHQKTDSGFELRYQQIAPDKIELLIVGQTK